MDEKALRYLGLAKNAGAVVSGVNTCAFHMKKGKVALMILAGDISENSEKKIMKEIRRYGVDFIRYSSAEELSRATGGAGRSVFGITDNQFAKTIRNEIMREKE